MLGQHQLETAQPRERCQREQCMTLRLESNTQDGQAAPEPVSQNAGDAPKIRVART